MSPKQFSVLAIAAAILVNLSFYIGRSTGSADGEAAAESMATFMSTYSALAYLEKGDTRSAMLVLRDLAEKNLLAVHRDGNPQLEQFRPGATNRWFAEYAALRKKLPSHPKGMGGEEFDKEVEAILSKATTRQLPKSTE